MYSGCVDCNRLLCTEVWTILQIVVLALLFSLKPQASKTTKILLANCLVNSGTSSDTFSVVVSNICPPISLSFYVPKDHVFDRNWHSWNFPWNIRFPASPGFAQVLQNSFAFVLLDPFWHHVQNIMHDSRTELKIIMRLDTLLCNRFSNTFAVSALELSSKEISKPSLQQRHYSSQKEEPDTPTRSPKSTSRAFANWSSIESIIN
mmetsp:Transcript_36325/g.81860  ORF Transcript_36325/g.81860 Transcript_36325/m.81860 type:complete len:205 (-) Transcript_36325:1970-2584(-)